MVCRLVIFFLLIFEDCHIDTFNAMRKQHPYHEY